MTATRTPPADLLAHRLALPVALDAAHGAHEPPEARGVPRDQVSLLVSPGQDEPRHHRFDDLPDLLGPGDLLVVNTSGTIAAAAAVTADGTRLVIHVSTELPGGLWMVEPPRPIAGGSTRPLRLAAAPRTVNLLDGAESDGGCQCRSADRGELASVSAHTPATPVVASPAASSKP